jgi:potassium efflux system protein
MARQNTQSQWDPYSEAVMWLDELLNTKLFELTGTPVTVGTLFMALFIIVVAFGVSRALQHGVARFFTRRGLSAHGINVLFPRVIHYTVVIVGFAVALDTIGFSLTALFAAGAVFAVGLGFAMQNIAQNFVSGMILLVERSIKPGDIIEVEGAVVKVVNMGIRTTVAKTRDDEELIIPNSILVQSTVKNYTLRDSLYRVRALVGVTYGSDLRLVDSTLRAVTGSLAGNAPLREPRIQLTEFGNSSVNFDASIWIEDPWEAPRTRSDLHLAIWWAFKDAGIVIAFPQLDIHLDPPVTDGLSRLPVSAA